MTFELNTKMKGAYWKQLCTINLQIICSNSVWVNWLTRLDEVQISFLKRAAFRLQRLLVLQTPGIRDWTHKLEKMLFSKLGCSVFFVVFILSSFLFTKIAIVTLTTKKDFLHRALLFLLWVIKLYKLADVHHNAISAWPSGLTKYYHQSELPILITSLLKNQTDARIKSTAIRTQINCREFLFPSERSQ